LKTWLSGRHYFGNFRNLNNKMAVNQTKKLLYSYFFTFFQMRNLTA
jgi:hypothetical protein